VTAIEKIEGYSVSVSRGLGGVARNAVILLDSTHPVMKRAAKTAIAAGLKLPQNSIHVDMQSVDR